MKKKDQIKLMMRLQSRFRANWKKRKEKLFSTKQNYAASYKTVEEKDVKKGLDIVVDCWLTSMNEEIARLQREEHRSEQQLIEINNGEKG